MTVTFTGYRTIAAVKCSVGLKRNCGKSACTHIASPQCAAQVCCASACGSVGGFPPRRQAAWPLTYPPLLPNASFPEIMSKEPRRYRRHRESAEQSGRSYCGSPFHAHNTALLTFTSLLLCVSPSSCFLPLPPHTLVSDTFCFPQHHPPTYAPILELLLYYYFFFRFILFPCK